MTETEINTQARIVVLRLMERLDDWDTRMRDEMQLQFDEERQIQYRAYLAAIGDVSLDFYRVRAKGIDAIKKLYGRLIDKRNEMDMVMNSSPFVEEYFATYVGRSLKAFATVYEQAAAWLDEALSEAKLW